MDKSAYLQYKNWHHKNCQYLTFYCATRQNNGKTSFQNNLKICLKDKEFRNKTYCELKIQFPPLTNSRQGENDNNPYTGQGANVKTEITIGKSHF